MRLVLASTSPRRKELLGQLGLEFDIIPSEFDEASVETADPAQLVRELALGKARAVLDGLTGDTLVIGADTIVLLEGEILGKPCDEAEARAMLARLAGRTHRVLTGIALVHLPDGRQAVDHTETAVTMRSLTRQEIDSYVASGEPMDKAGAYAVQGLGSVLVERLDGDYFTVVGLPLPRLARLLEDFGLNVLANATR